VLHGPKERFGDAPNSVYESILPKVPMRKSYGFRTYRVLELALYHSLGELPEPESTHDFL
jgi:hypothetical protein